MIIKVICGYSLFNILNSIFNTGNDKILTRFLKLKLRRACLKFLKVTNQKIRAIRKCFESIKKHVFNRFKNNESGLYFFVFKPSEKILVN
jgi:hypothetical protein